MDKSLWDHLCDVLDDLEKSNFKRFIDKLCQSRQEPRIRRNNVDGKDTSDIARLLIDKYTEERAVEVTVETLRSVGLNQNANELEKIFRSIQSQPVDPSPPVPQPAPPAPPEIGQSDILILSDVQFKQKVFQEKGNDIYNVKEKQSRERLALLINNVEFDCKSLKRNGAEKDEENMEKLLTALGYKVVKHTNLSANEMDEKIKHFAKRTEHANSDSTFVVIMSHGQRDAILGVHYGPKNKADALPVDRIYVHLNASNCPSLHNKPKVILIQACRGGEDGAVWCPDGEELEMCDMESDDVVHKEKDFISLLSCTPDTKSYRHREQGTLFVRYLVDVFNVSAHKDDIEELFRQVMMRFENFKSLRQMVCKDRTSLVKLFYLFPGL